MMKKNMLNENAKIVSLNGGHYLHNYFPEEISNMSKISVKNLK